MKRRPAKGFASRTSLIDFATPRRGWGLAYREPRSDERVTTLYGTSDGGRTWRRLRNPCAGWSGFARAAFASAQRGWVVCSGQPGAGNQEKTVYETRDGGRTWRNRACACVQASRGRLPSFGYVAGLDFADGGAGLVLQHRGAPILVSHDSGRTWIERLVRRAELECGVDA